MEFDDLVRILKRIDIPDKNGSVQRLSGLYKSKLKGDGISFDSIRKYEPGDDVRDINWNVTARFREPYINTFTEDKQRLIWILIDVSRSSIFGTANRNKIDLEIEIAAILAYNAIKSNDSVGVLFFNDKVEKLIQPAKGMRHFWLVARAMVNIQPCGQSTSIGNALELLMKISNKRSLIFLLSDFVDADYSPHVKVLSQKHTLIAMKVYDEKERNFPDAGWVKLRDAESGRVKWVNSRSANFKKSFSNQFKKVDDYFNDAFAHNRLNTLEIATGDDVAKKLLNFIIY